MGQILRPIATTIATGIASGDHTSIDETSASDADYVRTNALPNGDYYWYECLLSPPPLPPGPGVSTLRWRWQEEGTTGDVNIRPRIMQGGAEIVGLPFIGSGVGNTWWNETGNVDLSAIDDWANVRTNFRFNVVPYVAGIRGRLSFMELEVPDPLPSGIWF